MKTPLRWLVAAVALLLATGCATTESRISSHQAAFDAWPAAVKEKVRAGRVEVGFTPEMVLVALGEADRKATRTTAKGTDEVWAYFDHGPKFSFGIGMGSSHGSTAVGGGVVVGDNGFQDDEIMRVIFSGGRVTAVETRNR